MQVLSLQAIFLFYGIFLISCVLWMVWLFRSHADTSAWLWITSALLTAIATSVTAWRGDLPHWLGYLLPNVLQIFHCLLASLAVWALSRPIARLPQVLAVVVLCALLYGAGLTALSQAYPQGLVVYVSLANGVALVGPALWISRRLGQGDWDRSLRRLLAVMGAIGVLWLLRIPAFWIGQGAHAMDPKLMNWLVFTSMLGLGIAKQFTYIGVRYFRVYENRLVLARTQARLAQVLSERDALQRLQHAPSGALASQMAHEINQPLAAIRLSLECAARQPFHPMSSGEFDHLLQDIDRISASLERARVLAHGPAPQLAEVPLLKLVAHLRESASVAGLRLRVRGEVPAVAVRCDPDLLSAAWVAVLQRWVHETADDLVLSLDEPGPLRVRMVMRLSLSSLKVSLPDLQQAPGLHAATPQSADALLDLLTLDHLARAHAGHLRLRPGQADARHLDMELVLAQIPSTQTLPASARTATC